MDQCLYVKAALSAHLIDAFFSNPVPTPSNEPQWRGGSGLTGVMFKHIGDVFNPHSGSIISWLVAHGRRIRPKAFCGSDRVDSALLNEHDDELCDGAR